jgi:cytochrome P450
VVTDDEISGFKLQGGTYVFVSPWVTHRHPGVWDNPEGFDPERFLPERAEGRPKSAYMPFGGGPRMCIGMGFALTELQMVLSRIVQRYRLELASTHPVVLEPVVTLRPKGGLPMRLRKQAPVARA